MINFRLPALQDLSQVAKDFIKPLSTYTLCSIGGEGTSKVIGFKVE